MEGERIQMKEYYKMIQGILYNINLLLRAKHATGSDHIALPLTECEADIIREILGNYLTKIDND